jgi:carboxymethylenebutenolidase
VGNGLPVLGFAQNAPDRRMVARRRRIPRATRPAACGRAKNYSSSLRFPAGQVRDLPGGGAATIGVLSWRRIRGHHGQTEFPPAQAAIAAGGPAFMFDRAIAGASPAFRYRRPARLLLGVFATVCLALLVILPALAQTAQPRTVNFLSADGKTDLIGYLFAPTGRPKTAPAVVLMHGRSGVYSALAKGKYSSVTINKQIRDWAQLWSAQGYWALVVDSFGPRGMPGGFSATADRSRPAALSDVTVRPLDAYGALRYLRASSRVRGDRIGIEGWSGGGSTVLAAMSPQFLPAGDAGKGFRAGLAFYPACGLLGHGKTPYLPYAPVRIFMSTRDQDAAAGTCQKLVAASKAAGGDIAISMFEDEAHGLEDPNRQHQATPAAMAAAESRRQATALFTAVLGR